MTMVLRRPKPSPAFDPSGTLVALYLGVGLVSAAGIAFEVTLTRLFAIAQGYHFGFLAVSLALLGFGASGTALALRPELARGAVTPVLALLAFLFSLSLVAGYLAIDYLPFDSYRVAWERVQLLYLLLYYLALVLPFFFGGLVLGLSLSAFPQGVPRIYAANLAGSSLGCLAALGALSLFGGSGAVVISALLAAGGALAFSIRFPRLSLEIGDSAPSRLRSLLPVVSLLLVALLGVLLGTSPPFLELRTSPYKSLSQTLRLPDARLVSSAWNAFSRVDVVESAAIRSAPGLSLAYRGLLPSQRALFEDAESVSPLTDTAPPALLDALPIGLAYQLRPSARVLMVKPGGGLEVLAALNGGAKEVVAVEDNPLIAAASETYAPHVFRDPRVRLVADGARSYAARTQDRFDLVQLALSDPFRPVTAGAYALGENYLYTREAFQAFLSLLDDDGILVVSRWLQLPPSEEVRAGALAIAALDCCTHDPSQHVLAFRSFSTILLLVKRTPFSPSEIALARTFAEERQFDWVAYPGMSSQETNRFNVLRTEEYSTVFRQLLDPNQRERLFATWAYDITPPTDDRPFFFHLFKWEQTPQVLQLLGKLWQPFGGSGYLVLLGLLALSIAASAILILLPLLVMRRARRRWGRSHLLLLYFAGLGAGYLFVEIPLIQRFVLFLDRPVYAFATVLFTLLLASGMGSSLSARVPARVTLLSIVCAILIYPFVLPTLFQVLIGYPLAVRVAAAIIVLAPLGFLMGIPFPQGLAQLNRNAPGLVPLAWGVNGCASVISSVVATIGAMGWGFSAVMLAGAAAYAVALGTITFPASEARTARP